MDGIKHTGARGYSPIRGEYVRVLQTAILRPPGYKLAPPLSIKLIN